MSTQFQFFGFKPTYHLRKKACRSLNRLLDISPYGSMAVAILEKTQDGFRCAIDIYTRYGPLISQIRSKTAHKAIERVCETLEGKINTWRSCRFLYTSDHNSKPTLKTATASCS